MAETLARTRCRACGNGLPYDAWSRGESTCAACSQRGSEQPAAVYVRGPAAPARRVPATREPDVEDYERLLDEMPDELVDELVAALEAEMARVERADVPRGAVHEVLTELGIGRGEGEWQWAAWGFAAGFAANVALAKYAQMSSGGAMGDFAAPLLIGGMVAGATCAAIAWGLARLRSH